MERTRTYVPSLSRALFARLSGSTHACLPVSVQWAFHFNIQWNLLHVIVIVYITFEWRNECVRVFLFEHEWVWWRKRFTKIEQKLIQGRPEKSTSTATATTTTIGEYKVFSLFRVQLEVFAFFLLSSTLLLSITEDLHIWNEFMTTTKSNLMDLTMTKMTGK